MQEKKIAEIRKTLTYGVPLEDLPSMTHEQGTYFYTFVLKFGLTLESFQSRNVSLKPESN